MKRVLLCTVSLLLLLAACGASNTAEPVGEVEPPAVVESEPEAAEAEELEELEEPDFFEEEEFEEPEVPPEALEGENNVVFLYLQNSYSVEEVLAEEFLFASLVRNNSSHYVWIPALFSLEYLDGEEWRQMPYSDSWTTWPSGYVLMLGEEEEGEKFYPFDLFSPESFVPGEYRIVQVVEAFDERDEFMFSTRTQIPFSLE